MYLTQIIGKRPHQSEALELDQAELHAARLFSSMPQWSDKRDVMKREYEFKDWGSTPVF